VSGAGGILISLPALRSVALSRSVIVQEKRPKPRLLDVNVSVLGGLYRLQKDGAAMKKHVGVAPSVNAKARFVVGSVPINVAWLRLGAY
jgi:hypothetical protein